MLSQDSSPTHSFQSQILLEIGQSKNCTGGESVNESVTRVEKMDHKVVRDFSNAGWSAIVTTGRDAGIELLMLRY